MRFAPKNLIDQREVGKSRPHVYTLGVECPSFAEALFSMLARLSCLLWKSTVEAVTGIASAKVFVELDQPLLARRL
jgi:hypothetical protein